MSDEKLNVIHAATAAYVNGELDAKSAWAAVEVIYHARVRALAQEADLKAAIAERDARYDSPLPFEPYPVEPGPIDKPIIAAAPDNNAVREAIGKVVAPKAAKPKPKRVRGKGSVRVSDPELKALRSFAGKHKLGPVRRDRGGWVNSPAVTAWVEAGRPGV